MHSLSLIMCLCFPVLWHTPYKSGNKVLHLPESGTYCSDNLHLPVPDRRSVVHSFESGVGLLHPQGHQAGRPGEQLEGGRFPTRDCWEGTEQAEAEGDDPQQQGDGSVLLLPSPVRQWGPESGARGGLGSAKDTGQLGGSRSLIVLSGTILWTYRRVLLADVFRLLALVIPLAAALSLSVA